MAKKKRNRYVAPTTVEVEETSTGPFELFTDEEIGSLTADEATTEIDDVIKAFESGDTTNIGNRQDLVAYINKLVAHVATTGELLPEETRRMVVEAGAEFVGEIGENEFGTDDNVEGTVTGITSEYEMRAPREPAPVSADEVPPSGDSDEIVPEVTEEPTGEEVVRPDADPSTIVEPIVPYEEVPYEATVEYFMDETSTQFGNGSFTEQPPHISDKTPSEKRQLIVDALATNPFGETYTSVEDFYGDFEANYGTRLLEIMKEEYGLMVDQYFAEFSNPSEVTIVPPEEPRMPTTEEETSSQPVTDGESDPDATEATEATDDSAVVPPADTESDVEVPPADTEEDVVENEETSESPVVNEESASETDNSDPHASDDITEEQPPASDAEEVPTSVSDEAEPNTDDTRPDETDSTSGEEDATVTQPPSDATDSTENVEEPVENPDAVSNSDESAVEPPADGEETKEDEVEEVEVEVPAPTDTESDPAPSEEDTTGETTGETEPKDDETSSDASDAVSSEDESTVTQPETTEDRPETTEEENEVELPVTTDGEEEPATETEDETDEVPPTGGEDTQDPETEVTDPANDAVTNVPVGTEPSTSPVNNPTGEENKDPNEFSTENTNDFSAFVNLTLSQLRDYTQVMGIGNQVDKQTINLQQRRLNRLLTQVVMAAVHKDFEDLMYETVSLFIEHKDRCFSDIYVFRGIDQISALEMDNKERTRFYGMIDAFRGLADPTQHKRIANSYVFSEIRETVPEQYAARFILFCKRYAE